MVKLSKIQGRNIERKLRAVEEILREKSIISEEELNLKMKSIKNARRN